MTRTIACVACLDPKISVHTPTFLQAVDIAQQKLIGSDCTIALYDDRANADVSRQVAHEIARAKPDCVVGHFASAAAAQAAPIYEQVNIPLLLPAATMTALTQHHNVYRVCDNDADYISWLVNELDHSGLTLCEVISDNSVHGDSVQKMLGACHASTRTTNAKATCFTGSYKASVQFVATFKGTHLVLTDDADNASLAHDLVESGCDLSKTHVYLAALRPRPKASWLKKLAQGPSPRAYFWETLAAIQMAGYPNFARQPVDTVIGNLMPDANRECRPGSFALIRVGAP